MLIEVAHVIIWTTIAQFNLSTEVIYTMRPEAHNSFKTRKKSHFFWLAILNLNNETENYLISMCSFFMRAFVCVENLNGSLDADLFMVIVEYMLIICASADLVSDLVHVPCIQLCLWIVDHGKSLSMMVLASRLNMNFME